MHFGEVLEEERYQECIGVAYEAGISRRPGPRVVQRIAAVRAESGSLDPND